MFGLNAEVLRWRKHAEGRSALSPREVDELEDHLRARIDLELELNSALTPAQAFAAASEDVGEPAALSKEFARAGQPRWRRFLGVGLAMFAVSWFLPALADYGASPPPAPDGTILPQRVDLVIGWDAFGWALLRYAGIVGTLSALTNVLILVVGIRAYRKRGSGARWAFPIMVAATAFNSFYWPYWVTSEGGLGLRVGYVLWTASFALVAAALWLRAREWASAKPEKATA